MRRYVGQVEAAAADGSRFVLEVWDDGGPVIETMDGGRVVRVGPGEYVTAHPSHPVRLKSDDPAAP